MTPMDSSSIRAVGFDARSRTLYVEFRESGETYVYDGIDESLYQELVAAQSKGSFFNRRIRNNFPYFRI